MAAYSVTGQKQFKNKYYSTIVATAGRERSYSSRTDTYNEIARRESSRSESEDMSVSTSYSGGYRFNVKDRNDILLDGSLSFSQNRNLSGSMDSTLFNADEYISRLLQDGRNRSFASELHLYYTRMFDKPERQLVLDVSLPFSLIRGSGSTVDTLKTTTYPQFMTRRNGSDSFTPKVRLQYSEPIVRYLSFDLSGTFDGEWSDKNLYSFDRLLMQEDRVNTWCQCKVYSPADRRTALPCREQQGVLACRPEAGSQLAEAFVQSQSDIYGISCVSFSGAAP